MHSLRIAFALIVLAVAVTAGAQSYRYEAEAAQLFGTTISSFAPGYSGTGYVTGFNSGDGTDAVRWSVDVPDGLYEMWVGYRSQYGPKGYEFAVDGEAGSGMFDQSSSFSTDRAGLFNLAAGVNEFSITQGWGYYDVDYVEFRPFTPPAITPIAPTLVDSQANAETRVLMNYLATQYGAKTLAGQQHSVRKNLPFPGASYLSRSGGLTPAVRGTDFIEYSPSRLEHNSNPRQETEQTIAWAKQTGGVVTAMWHWNAPADLINQPDKEWWRGFYTYATTFDLPAALADPQGADYQLLLRDIDAIAVELQKYEDAGVPVLWRPLHEAQGGWFWWGAHGPETFKELWNLTYDRLQNHHGLHNLIWEFTSSAAEGDFLDWYPGDDVVDMIGLDIYTDPTASMSGQWYDILQEFDGRKLIALSETGTLPDPEVMDQWGIRWSYFSPWSGSFVDSLTAEQLQATLGHENIVTLDELPALPWSDAAAYQSADVNFDGVVDGADLESWLAGFGQFDGAGARAEFVDGDFDGNRIVDGADFLAWQRQTQPGAAPTSAVPEPPAAWLIALVAVATAPVLRGTLGAALRRSSHTAVLS